MRLTKTVIWATLVCCAWADLAIAGVPIDEPTPPPCCADGNCYPKAWTWGYYPGRWRRWPGEELVPEPSAVEPTTPAETLGPDLKPFETPKPEQEEERAAPPVRKEEPVEGAAPTPPTGETMTEEPPTPRVPLLPRSDTQPSEDDAPPTLPFGTTPPSDEPPRLPFETPSENLFPSVPGDQPIPPELHLRLDRPRRTPADDPPPPLPISLRGVAPQPMTSAMGGATGPRAAAADGAAALSPRLPLPTRAPRFAPSSTSSSESNRRVTAL